jgi:hypothetical protein
MSKLASILGDLERWLVISFSVRLLLVEERVPRVAIVFVVKRTQPFDALWLGSPAVRARSEYPIFPNTELAREGGGTRQFDVATDFLGLSLMDSK